MVISQKTKLLLDNLYAMILEMRQTISYLNEVLEQNYGRDCKQRINIATSGIVSQIKQELIIKAYVDSRQNQLSGSDIQLMKEKLKQEYLLLYKSYHEHIEDLKSCNLTDIESSIDPTAISLLSQTLQSATALIVECCSKENYKLKTGLLQSVNERLGMISTCFLLSK